MLAHPVGQREEEFVTVEMAAAERQHGLVDQGAVGGDVLGLGFELIGPVGDDIERDVVAEIPVFEMKPGEDRRIDQRLVVGLGPGRGGWHAVKGRRARRRRSSPAAG